MNIHCGMEYGDWGMAPYYSERSENIDECHVLQSRSDLIGGWHEIMTLHSLGWYSK